MPGCATAGTASAPPGRGTRPTWASPATGSPLRGATRAFAVIGTSGARSLRHFCPTCGTHVFGVRDPDDGTYTIYAGTLDDPELFAPREAIFVRSRLSWDHGALKLPEFEALP